MITHVLNKSSIGDSPLIYATRFTEANALERYLDSFPEASPTQFQMSIHPGGIEQALILNTTAVTEIIPLAGGDDLVLSSLQQVFLSDKEEVILVAGEERGTWLLDFGLASEDSFAFVAIFSTQPECASLSIRWDPDVADLRIDCPDMQTFANMLSNGQPQRIEHPGFGRFTIEAIQTNGK